MNISEAGAVSRLLRFATGEHLPRDAEQIDQLAADARWLAERINKALMAGPLPDDVETRIRIRIDELLLEHDDDYVEDAHDERPVEDVPVTGGRL